MDKERKREILEDLRSLLEDLKTYKDLIHKFSALALHGLDPTARQANNGELEQLRESLLRRLSRLGPAVETYGARYDLRPPFSQNFIRNYNYLAGALGTVHPPSGSISSDLDYSIDAVNRAIGALEAPEGTAVSTNGTAEKPERAKAFIAHGPPSAALNKLCEFLDELRIKPLVVERLPSEGRSVNENVEFYLSQGDCGIALATKDDLVDGSFQARGNVHIEIGRFQERYPERIIYLLEEGAAFPSNVSEKVWARFRQDSMDEAFLMIVRELKAFGLL